jgi:hypothetical protein
MKSVLAIIMVVGSITLLLLIIAGRFVPRVAMSAKRQRWAVIISGGLLVLGIITQYGPNPTKTKIERMDTKPTELVPVTVPVMVVIDQILATLPLANIAFNAPPTLRLGHSAVIQLFLSMQHSIEQLQATINAVGESEGASIRVSPEMEARLSGVGFKIEAITAEVQAISERDRTEWKWEIEPTKAGRQNLHLTLSAILDVANNHVRRTVRTFERTIEVDEVVVPWPQRLSQFAKDNWQWLWAAIVIPVGGWIVGWLRKRRKEKTTDWGGLYNSPDGDFLHQF